MVFTSALVVGIVVWDYLAYQCAWRGGKQFEGHSFGWNSLTLLFHDPADFSLNSPPYVPKINSSCLLPTSLCAATEYDGFLFSCMLWASLQLTWTSVLLIAHSWQISRQMTTLEVSNLGRYGYMGGRGGSSMSSQTHFMESRAEASPSSLVAQGGQSNDGSGGDGGGSGDDHGDGASSGRPHQHASLTHVMRGTGNWLLSIVGLDLYTKGKGGEGLKKASRSQNPFDQGLLINCEDFWTRGRVLGVKYEELYDVPPGGFSPQASKRAGIWLTNLLGVQLLDGDGEPASSTQGDGAQATAPHMHSRRWTMWNSVKRSLPRMTNARGDYALVQSQGEGAEMA